MSTTPTRRVRMSCGEYLIIDVEDYDLVKHHNWFASRRPDGRIYCVRRNLPRNRGPKRAQTIQVLLGGKAPDGFVWDHIDRNVKNNRRDNLRLVTHRESNINRRAWGKSGVAGVYQDRGRWRVQIWRQGRSIHLGMYDTKREAVAARAAAMHKET